MDVEGSPADAQEAVTSTDVAAWPSAPEYDWSKQPREVVKADCPPSGAIRHNFFRAARWSSDGSALLTLAEDRIIRIYDSPGGPEEDSDFGKYRAFPQPDAINAVQWYPSASSSSPETFCFIASIRDSPVRLVDATDGRVRATYPIVDHRERYVSPHSMAFNPSGTKVYCGHENAVEVLDISTPGHDTSERLKTISSKRESGGQRGIISALAFCPDYSGTYAAGSFNGSVSIYSEDTGSTPLAQLEGVHTGGVTQLAFHPLAPNILFVGSRRSGSIQVFDIRDVTAPVSEMVRPAWTNQRLLFDVDPWGRWLAAGDQDGKVRVWDISDLSKTEPVFEHKLHADGVGSVQLHPFKPLLLSVSGSRDMLFDAAASEDGFSSSDEASSSDEGSSDEDEERVARGPGELSSVTGQTLPIPDTPAGTMPMHVEGVERSTTARRSGLAISTFA